jgi:hypothetical protein
MCVMCVYAYVTCEPHVSDRMQWWYIIIVICKENFPLTDQQDEPRLTMKALGARHTSTTTFILVFNAINDSTCCTPFLDNFCLCTRWIEILFYLLLPSLDASFIKVLADFHLWQKQNLSNSAIFQCCAFVLWEMVTGCYSFVAANICITLIWYIN